MLQCTSVPVVVIIWIIDNCCSRGTMGALRPRCGPFGMEDTSFLALKTERLKIFNQDKLADS